MLERVSSHLAGLLAVRLHADEEKREVFAYGLCQVISTLGWLLSILTLALLFFDWRYFVGFLLFYMPIRQFGGGLHCQTYLGCFLSSNLQFLIACSLVRWTAGFLYPYGFLILGVAVFLFIFFAAPVMNEQHPLSRRGVRRNRTAARKTLLVEGAAILLFITAFKSVFWTAMSSFAVALVAALMLIQLIKERGSYLWKAS